MAALPPTSPRRYRRAALSTRIRREGVCQPVVRRAVQDIGMSDADTGSSCQCASGFIHVADWAKLDEEHWCLQTRCADCGSFRDIVVGRSEAVVFEEAV